MKKLIFMALSLVVISLFLVGCAQEKASDEELEAQLSELSDEELDQAIEIVEAEDTSALAGQAYSFRNIPSHIPKDKFLKTAYKVKSLIELTCPIGYYYISKEDPSASHCNTMDNNLASYSGWYACGYDTIPDNACPNGLSLKKIGLGIPMSPNTYEQQYVCEKYGIPITSEEIKCGGIFEPINKELGFYYIVGTECKATLNQACVDSLYSDLQASGTTPYSNVDWLNEYLYKMDVVCCSNSNKVIYNYNCADQIAFSAPNLETACKSGFKGKLMPMSMGVCCLKE